MRHLQVGSSLGRTENWKKIDATGEKDAQKQTGASCIETNS